MISGQSKKLTHQIQSSLLQPSTQKSTNNSTKDAKKKYNTPVDTNHISNPIQKIVSPEVVGTRNYALVNGEIVLTNS
jgi:hypothetical protein